jgi:hypothetical protein
VPVLAHSTRCARTRGAQLVPALAGEEALEALVGELRVGDRRLAAQRREPLALRAGAAGEPLVDQLVDRHVDAAAEEARHAGHRARVAAARDERLQAAEVGFDHLFVNLLREEQRDVDLDARGGQLADRRQPGARRRHLDHDVVAAGGLGEPFRLGDRRGRVHREIGRDLEADEAVAAAGRLVHRPQHVGGAADVFEREAFVERHDAAVAGALGLLERGVVVAAAGDRLLEDRRVRRHAGKPVALDQPREIALGNEAPRKKVEPKGLAVLVQRAQGIDRSAGHGRDEARRSGAARAGPGRASSAFARAQTLSAVKP